MKEILEKLHAAGAAVLMVAGAAAEQAKLAGMTVNATGTDRSTPCAGVEDFLFVPGASLAQMEVSYTCPDDGKRRICQPAPATPPAEPGTPAVAMYPTVHLVSLACEPASFVLESPRLTASVDGVDESCPSVTSIHMSVITADQCVAGAGPLAATCLRWTCEGSATERACFPLRPVKTNAAPVGSGATTLTTVVCEQVVPLLADEFE